MDIEDINDDGVPVEETDDTSIEMGVEEQGLLSTNAILLRVLGGLCIAVAAIDFVIYNLGIYDMYAGIPFVNQIAAGPISLGFFTVIILGCIGGALCRAGKNTSGQTTENQNALGLVGCAWLLILVVTNVGAGFGGLYSNSDTELVKNGYMYGCTNHTVGEIADSSISDAQWDTFYGDDGNVYVNLSGIVTFDQELEDGTLYRRNAAATVMFQFQVKDDAFELYAVTIDGKPPDTKTGELLFKKICP